MEPGSETLLNITESKKSDHYTIISSEDLNFIISDLNLTPMFKTLFDHI
ncbi:hypothetical protein [uncultured Methanobrevibacter sp.]|nr:hypothetical protein [uncultured Methanobrevibacter sp.]